MNFTGEVTQSGVFELFTKVNCTFGGCPIDSYVNSGKKAGAEQKDPLHYFNMIM